MQEEAEKGNPVPTSLLRRLKGEYQLGTKTQYSGGKCMKIAGNKFEPAGLFLFPCMYFGWSPEEASNSKGILKIKCPWEHGNSSFEEMINTELKGKCEMRSII